MQESRYLPAWRTALRTSENNDSPSLFELSRTFLLIGALAFGGQGGLLALLNRDLVERRQWITEADILEAFTYVQLLPGAVVVQVAAYLGYKLRSWPGAIAATFSFLLPSVVVMFLLAAAYKSVSAITGAPAALQGLTAAVVGLIAVAAWKQGQKTITDRLGISIAIIVCAVSVVCHVNPAVLVVAAGSIGVLREVIRGRAPAADTKDGAS
jgi:chromate transporter